MCIRDSYTIDRFKIILADTQQGQVAFDDIRVLDPTLPAMESEAKAGSPQ